MSVRDRNTTQRGRALFLLCALVSLSTVLLPGKMCAAEHGAASLVTTGWFFSSSGSGKVVHNAEKELAKLEKALAAAEEDFRAAKAAFDAAPAQKRSEAVKLLVENRRKRDALAQETMAARTRVEQLRNAESKERVEKAQAETQAKKQTKVAAEKSGEKVIQTTKPASPVVAEKKTEPVSAGMAEAKPVVQKTVEPKKVCPKEKAEKVTPVQTESSAPSEVLRRSGEGKYSIRAIVIIGDREEVYGLKRWNDLEKEVLGTTISDTDIDTIRKWILQKLQAQGYVFSKVDVDRPALGVGFLAYNVQVGEIGDVSIVGNRHYRADQIIKNVDAKSGEGFNYRELYENIFSLNVKPDVTVDTKLKPRDEADGRRIIDMEVSVRDRLPIHGALNLSNTGSKDTGDWRLRTTLQHLNLTKNDDILSLQWLTDPQELDEVNAFSASYFRPLGETWDATVYGGYSESDIDGLYTDFDVRGEGHFVGLRLSRILAQNAQRSVDLAFGYTYQLVENSTDFAGFAFQDKTTQLGTPYVTLGYADKLFDKYGGRNFMSGTVLFNWEDQLGSYDEDEFHKNYPDTDASFTITRLQAARFQKLYTGSEAPGKWTLMAKASAQLTGDTLVPAVQTFVGGADSVRGYEEDEMSGDESLVVQLELRTPLFTNFIPGLERDEEFLRRNPDTWSQHRLQFVTFFDYGTLKRNDPLAGLQTHEDLIGAGLGLRMSLTKYFQLKFDYGFALEETEDSDDSGRGHISLQAQF